MHISQFTLSNTYIKALRVIFESIKKTYFVSFQLGIAIGFLLPPVIVRNHDDLDLVGQDLQLMFYLIAGFTTVLVVLVAVCKFYNCILYFCRLSDTMNAIRFDEMSLVQWENGTD